MLYKLLNELFSARFNIPFQSLSFHSQKRKNIHVRVYIYPFTNICTKAIHSLYDGLTTANRETNINRVYTDLQRTVWCRNPSKLLLVPRIFNTFEHTWIIGAKSM